MHVCLHTSARSPGGDLGAKKKKKKQKRKKEKPSSGGAKSDSASDSQEIKVKKKTVTALFSDVFIGQIRLDSTGQGIQIVLKRHYEVFGLKLVN